MVICGHVVTRFSQAILNDDACWAHLEAVRWPHGPVGARCGSIDNARRQPRASSGPVLYLGTSVLVGALGTLINDFLKRS